jgi:epimerase EvaD
MKARALSVAGALEFTPQVFEDERGLFVSPFQEPTFTQVTRGPLFRVAQTNHSMSRNGTIRGIHYTRTPPGSAKYVYCAGGSAIDFVVDLRTGSPTFGRWDSVVMDQQDFRATYLPVGVGHAFIALEDSTVMSYLVSQSYVADDELAVSVFDPALGLPVPQGRQLILSARDSAAPTLAQALALGLLPTYEGSQLIEKAESADRR